MEDLKTGRSSTVTADYSTVSEDSSSVQKAAKGKEVQSDYAITLPLEAEESEHEAVPKKKKPVKQKPPETEEYANSVLLGK